MRSKAIPIQSMKRQSSPSNLSHSTASPLAAQELLVYVVDGPLTVEDKGFKWMTAQSSSRDFGGVDIHKSMTMDWTQPVNYAEGIVHVYMKIRSQPYPQDMLVCWNPYQSKEGAEKGEDLYWHEIGTRREAVTGRPGNTYAWSFDLAHQGGPQCFRDGTDFWVKPRFPEGKRVEYPIDWSKPRFRQSVRFWHNRGEREPEVHKGMNWGGQDPLAWFPLDMLYLVVVVPKGGVFSGWQNYLDENGNYQPPRNQG